MIDYKNFKNILLFSASFLFGFSLAYFLGDTGVIFVFIIICIIITLLMYLTFENKRKIKSSK